MQIVPVKPIPNQSFPVTLNGQSCTINLYWKGLVNPFLYMDLYVNNILIIGGVMCLNANVIVRNTYLGFIGDLAFYDTQGATNPNYTGLGEQYILVYLAPGDVPGSTVQTLQVAA
jgi:hypothetical protein